MFAIFVERSDARQGAVIPFVVLQKSVARVIHEDLLPTPGEYYLNNYLTRVRLSVCLSVAMVPTLRHLRLRAAQTVASSRVKFAQFVVNELRHLHVEKRGRWGA